MPDYYRPVPGGPTTPPPADRYAAKREFARRLVERWHGAEAAAAAEAAFDRQFKQGRAAEDAPRCRCPPPIRCTCRRYLADERPGRLARRGPPTDRPGRRAHRRRAACGPSELDVARAPAGRRRAARWTTVLRSVDREPDRYTALSGPSPAGRVAAFRPERATCLAVSNSLGFVVASEGAWSLKTQQFGDLFGVVHIPERSTSGSSRLPREFHGGAETMSATLRHRPSGRRRWVRRPLRADRSARLDRSKLSFMVRDRPTIPHRATSWSGGGRFRNLFSESLILAQDERWRRA